MYAIMTTGGKQYKVSEGDVLQVELLPNVKKTVTISDVLMVCDGEKTQIGTPKLAQASVSCEVLGEFKGPKVISFKKKRRKGYSKKIGHRQRYTTLKVKKINIQ